MEYCKKFSKLSDNLKCSQLTHKADLRHSKFLSKIRSHMFTHVCPKMLRVFFNQGGFNAGKKNTANLSQNWLSKDKTKHFY